MTNKIKVIKKSICEKIKKKGCEINEKDYNT